MAAAVGERVGARGCGGAARRVAAGDGRRPAVSVVIPAHDEAAALPRCLDALLGQRWAGAMEIVVVANGCSDGTAGVARGYVAVAAACGHRLTVVDLPASSKPAALNAGDACTRAGVRVFLDADVCLSPNAIAAVLERLTSGAGTHLCAPAIRVRPPRSALTRQYVEVWSRLPYLRAQVIGCGFYAVTQEGRRRWDKFPELISDDKFVRLHFRPGEQQVADDAYFVVAFPERFRELLRVRGRWCRGNRQVAAAVPALRANDQSRIAATARFLCRHPALWGSVPTFSAVFAAGHLLAFLSRGAAGVSTWERAETSPARVG